MDKLFFHRTYKKRYPGRKSFCLNIEILRFKSTLRSVLDAMAWRLWAMSELSQTMTEFLLGHPGYSRCLKLIHWPNNPDAETTDWPVMGELLSGFGGRGWRAPFSTPIQRPFGVCMAPA